MRRIPKNYDPEVFEYIIKDLERQIAELSGIKLRRIKSVAAAVASNLSVNEPAYVLDDSNQGFDFVVKAEDGRLYRISGTASTSGGTSTSGSTNDHALLTNLSYATSGHTGFVSDAGDTITGAVTIDGSADAVQLTIQGNATQTSSLLVLEDSAGNDQITVSNDGAVVINEEGNDADFRVESDGDVNALYVDASANTVQVGAAAVSDSAKFYVAGKISTSAELEVNGDLNHDGSNIGFYGTAPTGQSTGWSVSNVTPDKSFDADSTSIDEIADVLGTLITYLLSRGDLAA